MEAKPDYDLVAHLTNYDFVRKEKIFNVIEKENFEIYDVSN